MCVEFNHRRDLWGICFFYKNFESTRCMALVCNALLRKIERQKAQKSHCVIIFSWRQMEYSWLFHHFRLSCWFYHTIYCNRTSLCCFQVSFLFKRENFMFVWKLKIDVISRGKQRIFGIPNPWKLRKKSRNPTVISSCKWRNFELKFFSYVGLVVLRIS
jgi:hypothetical protein